MVSPELWRDFMDAYQPGRQAVTLYVVLEGTTILGVFNMRDRAYEIRDEAKNRTVEVFTLNAYEPAP